MCPPRLLCLPTCQVLLLESTSGPAAPAVHLQTEACCFHTPLHTYLPAQVLLLENIGTSVRVGPDQLPSLHRLLAEAAAMLGMEPPDLYVRQVRQPTALADVLVLTDGLVLITVLG